MTASVKYTMKFLGPHRSAEATIKLFFLCVRPSFFGKKDLLLTRPAIPTMVSSDDDLKTVRNRVKTATGVEVAAEKDGGLGKDKESKKKFAEWKKTAGHLLQ